MPLDARRIAFTEEAYSVRAQAAISAIIGARRASHPVAIEASAEQLMRSVMNADEEK